MNARSQLLLAISCIVALLLIHPCWQFLRRKLTPGRVSPSTLYPRTLWKGLLVFGLVAVITLDLPVSATIIKRFPILLPSLIVIIVIPGWIGARRENMWLPQVAAFAAFLVYAGSEITYLGWPKTKNEQFLFVMLAGWFCLFQVIGIASHHFFGDTREWLQIWHARRIRAKYGPNACMKCGYDLTSNVSGRCPECGQGFVR